MTLLFNLKLNGQLQRIIELRAVGGVVFFEYEEPAAGAGFFELKGAFEGHEFFGHPWAPGRGESTGDDAAFGILQDEGEVALEKPGAPGLAPDSKRRAD